MLSIARLDIVARDGSLKIRVRTRTILALQDALGYYPFHSFNTRAPSNVRSVPVVPAGTSELAIGPRA